MIDKLGPFLCWALYIGLCRLVAPEILPFLFWTFVVLLAMYIMWQGWLRADAPEAPSEPHHSPLTGGLCWGAPKFLEYRKFHRDNVEQFEVTRQCPICKMSFFEKRPS